MPKSPAERKAAQRARQAAAGVKTLQLALDAQEVEIVAQNCAARRPGREPYELNEYIALLIRQDNARGVAVFVPSVSASAASVAIGCRSTPVRARVIRSAGSLADIRN